MKEEVLALFNAHPGLAIVISLGLSVLVAIVGILPSVFLTAANILFFGFLPGMLISFLGETIGAIVAFFLYRWGFKKKSFPPPASISTGATPGRSRKQGSLPPHLIPTPAALCSFRAGNFCCRHRKGGCPHLYHGQFFGQDPCPVAGRVFCTPGHQVRLGRKTNPGNCRPGIPLFGLATDQEERWLTVS